MKKDMLDLAGMSELFNNKTLRYRINGFAYACNMQDIGILGNSRVIFNCAGFDKYGKKKTNDEHSYFISVNEQTHHEKKGVVLKGQYDDLTFTFINYYNKEKLDKKIIDIPFYISLEKKIDKDKYQFDIETVDGMRTKFSIIKCTEYKNKTLHDDLCFYANVTDFSKVLKLIKSFVYNPKIYFDTYNELVKKKKIVFTNSMLCKMAMQDENLDKPVGKVKKIMKKIMD